jgi:hypothetical protein
MDASFTSLILPGNPRLLAHSRNIPVVEDLYLQKMHGNSEFGINMTLLDYT